MPGHEVDELAWLPMAAAARRLTYERDVEVLAECRRPGADRAGDPAPARLGREPVSLGRRGPGPPAGRPRRRPRRLLARLLPCFGVGRVISSAAERCVATVRPFAALAGAKIEIEPLFTVGVQAPPEVVTLKAAALATEDAPVAVCAHRENLPLLLAAVCARLDARPPGGRGLRKGRFWVMHVAAGGALAGAERHHPGVT